MAIHEAKASSYNTVNTNSICDYIKKYYQQIGELTQDQSKLENCSRTILKQCAAELETVVKRLEYGINGKY